MIEVTSTRCRLVNRGRVSDFAALYPTYEGCSCTEVATEVAGLAQLKESQALTHMNKSHRDETNKT